MDFADIGLNGGISHLWAHRPYKYSRIAIIIFSFQLLIIQYITLDSFRRPVMIY